MIPAHLAAFLLALAAGATPALAQDPLPPAVAGPEGPLDNDAYLPTSAAAAGRLAEGDRLFAGLLERGQAADPASEPRTWSLVFDAWRGALAESAPGDAVPPRPLGASGDWTSPWPDPDGTAAAGPAPRRVEGVELAVRRRLCALAPAVRAAWSARFEGLAATARAAAGADPAALAALERDHPATRAAAGAALALLDLALEEGRPGCAATWGRRTEQHLALLPPSDPAAALAGGLERRRAALARLASPPEPPEAWRTATRLQASGFAPLEDLTSRTVFQRPVPGLGLQPGACFLADGTALIQGPGRVVAFAPKGRAPAAEFEPGALLEPAGWVLPAPQPPRHPPGWPLLPATDGQTVVLVHGRADEAGPNALLAFELEPSGGIDPRLPQLRWALRGDALFVPGDGVVPLAPGTGAAGELQPGPVLHDGAVLVQVHEPAGEEAGGELRAHLLALDLASGRPRWKRFLARGLELSRSPGRFGGRASGPGASAGQPLALVGERVFAGTHLGAAALLDACDGRLVWSLRNRRRAAEAPGWTGLRPPVGEAPAAVVWAPADSDFLYWLDADPDPGSPQRPGGAGILLHPPRPQGEAEVLVDGDAGAALVLARSGAARGLSAWDAATGARRDGVTMPPGEGFTGPGLASGARALYASERGLYLFDRERELFALDQAPLAEVLAPGGAVHARGARVLVVGPHVVWTFEAR